MADTSGKLTQEEKDKVKLWVEGKSKTAECPICGSANWLIGDHIVMPIVVAHGSLMLGGVSYPQIMLVSTECGYTRYFNAILAGVVPPAPTEPNPQAQPAVQGGSNG